MTKTMATILIILCIIGVSVWVHLLNKENEPEPEQEGKNRISKLSTKLPKFGSIDLEKYDNTRG